MEGWRYIVGWVNEIQIPAFAGMTGWDGHSRVGAIQFH